MKLVIFNGSPRYKKSNSKLLIEAFLKGYTSHSDHTVQVHYIASRKDKQEQIMAFEEADLVLLVFPLYTDCMPGIVKEFFESIAGTSGSANKKLAFVVQSGFPEAVHSIYVERYLEKLTQRLGYNYLGTVIKGGVEGIQVLPTWMSKNIFKQFEALGQHLALQGELSARIKEELAHPHKMSRARIMLFKLFNSLGLSTAYWDSQLKKNKAYKVRFAKPYFEVDNERCDAPLGKKMSP